MSGHMDTWLSWQSARERLIADKSPLAATETVTLDGAAGRYLAIAPLSQTDMPPWDNSAMDGYAVSLGGEETAAAGSLFELVGNAFAGHPMERGLKPGQCATITTGAPVPAGTDTVVPVECASDTGGGVQLHEPVTAGKHIRRRGEDARCGDSVLSPGRRLSPRDIGALAALGIDRVSVYRRLKVGLISSGDELCAPGESLGPGQIYDANGPLLRAALISAGMEVEVLPLLTDCQSTMEQSLREASQRFDALVSSGGVSVGEADHLKAALQTLGRIDFWKVAIKPGKPFVAGRVGDCHFYGLPGNPVSAAVTFQVLALAGLEKQAGALVDRSLPFYQARAATGFKKRPGRTDFQRARRLERGDGIWVEPVPGQGSHQMQALAMADCLVALPDDSGGLAEGEWATVLPLPG